MRIKRKYFLRRSYLAVMLLITVVLVTGCGIDSQITRAGGIVPVFSAPPIPSTTISNILGAGSESFGRLSYRWFDEFARQTQIKVAYQPVGSSVIVGQLTAGTMDFAALDTILTTEQRTKLEEVRGNLLSIPVTGSIIALAYNLPDIPNSPLKLTSDILGKIYLKQIVRWNDSTIANLNPGLKLPEADIIVASHQENSGANFIFSSYLAEASQDWKAKPGGGSDKSLTADIHAVSDQGMAALIAQTPNSIGYVELYQAEQSHLQVASIDNISHQYILPSAAAGTKAMEGVSLPDNTLTGLVGSTDPGAYPLTGFIWILAYGDQKDYGIGQSLVAMLGWAIHDGQQDCDTLDYAPLSKSAISKAENLVESMKYQGAPLLNPTPTATP